MVKLSVESKQRLSKVFDVTRKTFQWGFIPLVLYLGMHFVEFLMVVLYSEGVSVWKLSFTVHVHLLSGIVLYYSLLVRISEHKA